MKKNNTKKLVLISLCVSINVIGALIAVALKLPIFLDTIGTFIVAFLFGPLSGVATGVLSYLITTLTFDPYAFYFIPSQVVVGLLAGFFYKKGAFRKRTIIPFITLTIAICSAFVAALASAFVFGGITSSGNSIIVMYLNSLGFGLVPSVFVTQILTEFIDKMIIVLLVFNAIRVIPKNFKIQSIY
ncbi:ECF transporter S component [Clostridium sp. D53t1_180928_C8]|uniref:ECF transporter S component n=1 Tax=Clostridium sp. D53t1_180928_C8 TaxID=2787101 RepID=UPI0018A93FB2|nr:ECF transporter S component [Clostridium sp. D53t1_180928_C8]